MLVQKKYFFIHLPWKKITNLKLLSQLLVALLALWLDRNVKVFSLLLGQQLEPKSHRMKRRAALGSGKKNAVSVRFHLVSSSSPHLTIRPRLVSAAPRSRRRGNPWSRSCWSGPSPTPPPTVGGLCRFLSGCCWGNDRWAKNQSDNNQWKSLGLPNHTQRGACSSVQTSYKVKLSFHTGFRQHLMVLVFCLLSLLGSGMSLSFT